MDFAGADWAYLIIQLTVFALIVAIVIGAVLYFIRKAKDD